MKDSDSTLEKLASLGNAIYLFCFFNILVLPTFVWAVGIVLHKY